MNSISSGCGSSCGSITSTVAVVETAASLSQGSRIRLRTRVHVNNVQNQTVDETRRQ